MHAMYNGVPMNVTRLVGHSAEAVYDESGVDYLWTRHVVSLEATVGVHADAYALPSLRVPGVGPVPVVVNNFRRNLVTGDTFPQGIESVAAIRHALAQPRQPFVLWEPATVAGSEPYVLLQSDWLDANNGPRPLEPVAVQSIHGGGRLAFVRFTLELCINECPLTRSLGNVPPVLSLLTLNGRPVLLSNRYTVGVAYDDENEAVTYTYTGRAQFRSDALALIGAASPDQFRGSLLPYPVFDCRRYIRRLDLSPDGLAIEYEIADQQTFRNYVDWQCRYDGTVKEPKPGDRLYRNVEQIDLVVDRSYSQPSVGQGLVSGLIEALSEAEFAVGGERQGAQNQAEVDKKQKLLAGLKVADSIVPSIREAATARVQLNREGRMADAQALAFALVSGALDIGTPQAFADLGRGVRQALRFGALPPASEFRLTYNPVKGWVECSLVMEQAGLIDFLVGGQQQGQGAMLRPLRDHVVGGRLPVSIFSVMDMLGVLNVNTLVGIGIADMAKLFQNKIETTRYSEQLLVTDAHIHVRGPSGDGFSRAALDLLIRSAQLLLTPCGTPLPPANQILPKLPELRPTDFRSGVVIDTDAIPDPTPKPPTPPKGKQPGEGVLIGGGGDRYLIANTTTPFTAARQQRKTVAELVAQWQSEMG